MTNYAELRRVMVDTQVRPSDVTKFPVIEAMLHTPREAFVPDALRPTAYAEDLIDLGSGRCMVEPRTLAKILDALNILPSEDVLCVAAGLGYSTAVAAEMAQLVVGVESDETLAADAQTALSGADVDNAIIHHGDLTEGAAEHGPYDVILVEGGVQEVPQALMDQLKDGGRIACIFMDGALGSVQIGHKSGDRVNWRFAFNATAPMLSGFVKAKPFTL